ncbi:hypothetical protein ACFL60_07185 [Candidatus Omnitrophota bacterium]
MGPKDFVISADEKTSIQARNRSHAVAVSPHHPQRYEFEYERGGALAYIAAWDVHNANLFGLCRQSTGITPNNFPNLLALEKQLLDFQLFYNSIAKPFKWKFTKDNLHQILKKTDLYSCHDNHAAA